MTISNNLIFHAKKFDRPIVSDIFATIESLTTEWWVDHGTLLGLIRENEFIHWDTDIDIGLWDNQPITPKKLLPILRSKYKHVYYDKICNCVKIKFLETGSKPWTVDIVFYNKEDDQAVKYWPNLEACSAPRRKLETVRSILDGNNAPTYPTKLKRAVAKIIHWLSINAIPELALTKITDYLRHATPTKKNTAPSFFFASTEVKTVNNYTIRTPQHPEEYLQFRYGAEWRVPKKSWNYLSDDGGLNQQSQNL